MKIRILSTIGTLALGVLIGLSVPSNEKVANTAHTPTPLEHLPITKEKALAALTFEDIVQAGYMKAGVEPVEQAPSVKKGETRHFYIYKVEIDGHVPTVVHGPRPVYKLIGVDLTTGKLWRYITDFRPDDGDIYEFSAPWVEEWKDFAQGQRIVSQQNEREEHAKTLAKYNFAR